MTKTPDLTFYVVKNPIVVSADVISYGLRGAICQQKGAELKHIAHCSRSMTNMETKYA